MKDNTDGRRKRHHGARSCRSRDLSAQPGGGQARKTQREEGSPRRFYACANRRQEDFSRQHFDVDFTQWLTFSELLGIMLLDCCPLGPTYITSLHHSPRLQRGGGSLSS